MTIAFCLFLITSSCLVVTILRVSLFERFFLLVSTIYSWRDRVMLRSNGIKNVLHDEGAKILGDEIEQEIVSKSLQEAVLGIAECSGYLLLIHYSLCSLVYGCNSQIMEKDCGQSVQQPHSSHGRKKD